MSVGSGFIAARTTRGSPFVTPASSPPARLVRRRRPGVAGSISSCACEPRTRASAKPSPISTPFDTGLDAHERGGEARVEALVSWSHRSRGPVAPVAAHLHHAPERSPRRLGLRRWRRLARPGRLAADLDAALPSTPIPSSRRSAFATAPAATCTAVCLALARSSASRTSSCPNLSVPARSAWPGPGQRHGLRALPGRLALGRPRAHPPRPVRVVAVPDDERQRRTEGAAVTKAGEHLHLVLLELLPGAPAVALLPPLQVGIDRVPVEDEAGGQPGDDRDERRPVRP